MSKTIKIDPVTRIEGHARILLDCDDSGKVTEASFCVNELRGFERILVGMDAATMPQVTARICGVCPTAHHLVAAKALDNAAGVEPPPAAKLLREFMYMGHMRLTDTEPYETGFWDQQRLKLLRGTVTGIDTSDKLVRLDQGEPFEAILGRPSFEGQSS